VVGGYESLRFGNSTDFNANYANGSLRFVRDTNGTASDFVSVNFSTAGQKFSGGGGFIIGSNVITTFATPSVFTNASGLLPTMTVETGGYFNLGSSAGAYSQSIRSLSGTGGYVTSLANVASNTTATLTISNAVGDSATFGGQIVDGSLLNAALGTSATNVKMALTKTGSGTQILSGSNSYTGTTTVSGGLLTIASNGSIQSSTNTIVNSSATLLMNGTGGRTEVNSGGTLKGSGSLGDVVLKGGTLSPGSSPGLLTAASLDASSSGKFFFEIGAPTSRGLTYDAINVGGLLTLSSSTVFNFSAWNSYTFQVSDAYDLLDWGNADFGSGATAFDSSTLLTSLNQDLALGAGMQWDVSTFTTDGKITVAVPEPSSGALLMMGFAMLVGIRALRRI
jgi:autotransporter-associated beta strand protein